jgi:hypothetical protein
MPCHGFLLVFYTSVLLTYVDLSMLPTSRIVIAGLRLTAHPGMTGKNMDGGAGARP